MTRLKKACIFIGYISAVFIAGFIGAVKLIEYLNKIDLY